MIHPEKDPTYKSLLLQTALKALGLYAGELDNWWGGKSEASYQAFLAGIEKMNPRLLAAMTLPVSRAQAASADEVAALREQLKHPPVHGG